MAPFCKLPARDTRLKESAAVSGALIDGDDLDRLEVGLEICQG
jgi:hypothetical protein